MKHYVSFLKYTVVILFIAVMLPIVTWADTYEDAHDKFIALGGSELGFEKIKSLVQKSEASSVALNNKIDTEYHHKMFDLMSANAFNSDKYVQLYNELEQQRSSLIKQNLLDLISLLKSLSATDRQAYAQLLYGISTPVNTPSKPANTNSSTTGVANSKVPANNTASNTINNTNKNTDNSVNAPANGSNGSVNSPLLNQPNPQTQVVPQNNNTNDSQVVNNRTATTNNYNNSANPQSNNNSYVSPAQGGYNMSSKYSQPY